MFRPPFEPWEYEPSLYEMEGMEAGEVAPLSSEPPEEDGGVASPDEAVPA